MDQYIKYLSNRSYTKPDNLFFNKDLLLSNQSKSKEIYNTDNLIHWIGNINDISHKKGYNIWMMINIELWMRKYDISL